MKKEFRKSATLSLPALAVILLAVTLAGAATPACISPAGMGQAPQTGAGSVSSAQPGTATITISDLPSEGRSTLKLIKSGGPFPYSKDGAVFGNYEGLLPAKPKGYYHEYTVVTPGSQDRGARRIVAGSGGEYYYTGDHYISFKLIQE
jgi:ribonuclease T1